MSYQVLACPECDDASVQRTGAPSIQESKSGDAYRCRACDATFNEGVTRKSKNKQSGLRGMAKQLDQMDPDAIGRGKDA